MSKFLGPDGQPLNGAVELGGRNLTITVSRKEEQVLKIISQSSGRSTRELAEGMFRQSLEATWMQMQMGKFIWACVNWWQWKTATLAK